MECMGGARGKRPAGSDCSMRRRGRAGSQRFQKIAALNDEFRKTLTGGMVVESGAVAESPYREKIRGAVRSYEFHAESARTIRGENSFGTVNVEGERYVFRIRYMDLVNPRRQSGDPTDPVKTLRILTITRADEY